MPVTHPPDLIDPPPPIINVDASAMTHTIPRLYLGCHSDSGYSHQTRGFYSQLIFGEVFEYGLWPNNISIGVRTLAQR